MSHTNHCYIECCTHGYKCAARTFSKQPREKNTQQQQQQQQAVLASTRSERAKATHRAIPSSLYGYENTPFDLKTLCVRNTYT